MIIKNIIIIGIIYSIGFSNYVVLQTSARNYVRNNDKLKIIKKNSNLAEDQIIIIKEKLLKLKNNENNKSIVINAPYKGTIKSYIANYKSLSKSILRQFNKILKNNTDFIQTDVIIVGVRGDKKGDASSMIWADTGGGVTISDSDKINQEAVSVLKLFEDGDFKEGFIKSDIFIIKYTDNKESAAVSYHRTLAAHNMNDTSRVIEYTDYHLKKFSISKEVVALLGFKAAIAEKNKKYKEFSNYIVSKEGKEIVKHLSKNL